MQILQPDVRVVLHMAVTLLANARSLSFSEPVC